MSASSVFCDRGDFRFLCYFRGMGLPAIPAALGNKYFRFLLPVSYLLLWAALLPYYRFRLYSDTFSYLDIARHYLRGDWYQALNGYWAPLISWLLVPFLQAGLDALLSFKILTMLSGLLALLGARRLMYTLEVMPLVRQLILLALVPLTAWFALQVNTPDLLSAALLLFYLSEACRLLQGRQGQQAGWRRQSLLVGVLAAAAYLSKNYNFFFVLVHLPGLFLLALTNKALRPDRRALAQRMGLAGLVFLLLAGCWILPLSYKYGRLSPGTAGTFNLNLAGPQAKGFPYLYQGLLPPPHPQCTHSWEDPGLYRLPRWRPWASGADLAHEVALLGRNAYKYGKMMGHYMPLVLVFVLLACWYTLLPGNKEKQLMGFSLFAFFLYPLGYWLIYLEERHIWINILLAFVITAQVLTMLLRQAKRWQQWLLLGVVCFTLVNQPLRDLYDHRFVNQRQFHRLAQDLAPRLALAGKNLATQDGNWYAGLFLSFFTGSRFYGQVKANLPDQDLYRDLQKHRIDYYLVWGKPKNNLSFLQQAVYLPEYDLTVYRVR